MVSDSNFFFLLFFQAFSSHLSMHPKWFFGLCITVSVILQIILLYNSPVFYAYIASSSKQLIQAFTRDEIIFKDGNHIQDANSVGDLSEDEAEYHMPHEYKNKSLHPGIKADLDTMEFNKTNNYDANVGKISRDMGTNGSCTEQINIYFIKTHKTGGTSICNILTRYGLKRNLTIALHRFGIKNIKPHSVNIVTSHWPYNEKVQDYIMKPGTSYITILREPFAQFVSAIIYFHEFTGLANVTGQNTEEKIVNYLRQHQHRAGAHPFIHNFMTNDLGFDSYQANENDVLRYIDHLEKRLDLVLILEHLLESLVLLRRTLCWSLKDIVFLKIQPLYDEEPKKLFPVHIKRFNESHRAMHMKFSSFDYLLYKHFLKTYRDKISKEGPDFRDEVVFLKIIVEMIESYCSTPYRLEPLYITATKWNKEFYVTKEDCQLMTMTDKDFVKVIIGRYKPGK